MDRKAQSKQMKEITSRLMSFGDFEVVNFGDEVSCWANSTFQSVVRGVCVGA
jgi:hypothetical protein